MSEVTVTIEQIKSVESHPNADRLEIARVAGTQTIILKGQFQAGDSVIYFPPDILLPGDVSDQLGVTQYLKTALWEGFRFPCRVAATRLQGVPSYGFIQPVPNDLFKWLKCDGCSFGTDVTGYYRAVKYEPPAKVYLDRKGAQDNGEI